MYNKNLQSCMDLMWWMLSWANKLNCWQCTRNSSNLQQREWLVLRSWVLVTGVLDWVLIGMLGELLCLPWRHVDGWNLTGARRLFVERTDGVGCPMTDGLTCPTGVVCLVAKRLLCRWTTGWWRDLFGFVHQFYHPLKSLGLLWSHVVIDICLQEFSRRLEIVGEHEV